MNCKNEYCIYQQEGVCCLSNISLDIQGSCEKCVYVDLDPAVLQKAKDAANKE